MKFLGYSTPSLKVLGSIPNVHSLPCRASLSKTPTLSLLLVDLSEFWIHAPPGKGRESDLTTSNAAISSSARAVGDLVRGHSEAVASVDPHLPCPPRVTTTREELHAAIRSLTSTSTSDQQGAECRQSAGYNTTGSYNSGNDDSDVSKDGSFRNKAAAKVLCSLVSDVSANRSPHWVWLTGVL